MTRSYSNVIDKLCRCSTYCHPCFSRGAHFVPFPVSQSIVAPHRRRPRARHVHFFVNVRHRQGTCGKASVVCRTLGGLTKRCPSHVRVIGTRSMPCTRCYSVVGDSSMLLSRLCSCAPTVGTLLTVTGNLILMKNKRRRGCRVLGRGRLQPVIGIHPSTRSMCTRVRGLVLRPRRVAHHSTRDVLCVRHRRSRIGITRRCIGF